MAGSSLLLPFAFLALLLLSSSTRGARAETEAAVTLDAGNFSEVVAANQFVLLNFHVPGCPWSDKLAPEYEEAAFILRNHDPPIVLAKIDLSDTKNNGIRDLYDVMGTPTIRFLRNRGGRVRGYWGERDAESIVRFLKKQVGPASVEIKSAEDAASSIVGKSLLTVGIFSAFVGSEYENFTAVAEKIRVDCADYDFLHTLDASIIPGSDKTTRGPIVRLFTVPLGLTIDSKDFDQGALEKFIRFHGFYSNPTDHKHIIKYSENGNNTKDSNLAPYVKSDPIPEVNDQPVKIIVANNLRDIVFNSGKNVLLQFYSARCDYCQKLAPILDEVAVSLQHDEDVIVAKMDVTTNDIPSDFKVEAYPTTYFYVSGGNLLLYDGGRTAEEIINFIKKNKGLKQHFHYNHGSKRGDDFLKYFRNLYRQSAFLP